MSHSAFARVAHRPWPLPPGPWTSAQTWRDLLFAHWPVPAAALRGAIPPGLELQEYEGSAWIGIVPFRMTGVRPRWVPPIPGLSAFAELNVRTYVQRDGMPGVWFLSLDATNPVAVWGARRFFHLPYHRARIDVGRRADGFAYRSQRQGRGTAVRFESEYRPTAPVQEASAGTLEHWLTERYCLYAQSATSALYRVQIHHHPWPLRRAEARIGVNTMLVPHAVGLPNTPPLLHFSHRIDVAIWSPERLCSR